jgi:thiosulfate/3-mercaptopyruvate sulfurtransferase
VTDRNGVPSMLPEPSQLATLIGGLGIGNGDHVVIVPAGTNAMEMSAATRIYWTFRMAGHDAVSILDGGMAAWTADPLRRVESGAIKREPETFRVVPRAELVATKAEVAALLGSDRVTLVDIRPSDQYLGVTKPPAPKRKGTLPGARNLPESWVTIDNGGTFRSAAALAQLAYVAGVPRKGPVIAFCNTGQLASLGWFVLHELLGNKEVRLYDGSMVEWTMDPATPVDLRIAVGP